MSIAKYESYIASDIVWIGDMPIHWKSQRLKMLFVRQQRDHSEDDGIVTAFRDGTVTLRSKRRTDGFTNALKEIGYQGVKAGDLVIHAMDAFAGAIGVSEDDGKSSPVYSVCTPRPNVDAHYYGHLLRYMSTTGFIASLSKGVRERSTEFRWVEAGNLSVPMPPIEEQRHIVHFLDRETAKIDALVEEQKRLIELLKEKRQAVISHAVTKGLDPSAPMKDSGIDWLGEVPVHWDVSPMKYLVTFRSGGTPSKAVEAYWNGEIPWVSSKDMKSDVILDTEDHISVFAISKGEAKIVDAGTVVVVVRGMILARTFPVSVLQKPMAINQDLKAIVPQHGMSSEFLSWALRASTSETLGRLDEAGHGTKALRMEAWSSMALPLPPMGEQDAIVDYLQRQTSQIDALLEASSSAITLFQERRSSLISAAVTGKIDVRDAIPAEAEAA